MSDECACFDDWAFCYASCGSNIVVPVHCALVDAPLALFPFLLLLGSDGDVVQLLCIQGAQRREECVIGPVVRTVENS